MIEIICSHASDGNMSKKYSENGLQRRNEFLLKHGINPKDAVLLNITNKDVIKYVNDNSYFKIDADAIITNKKNLFIYQVFGDCIPFVIYDKEKHSLGFAHLGWSSIYYNLHKKLIKEFLNNGSNIEDLKVILGPSIKKESYIKENPIQKDMDEWKDYVSNVKDNLYSVDIFNKVIDDIRKLNIQNIKYDYIDTYKDNTYFSHRRSVEQKESEKRFLYGVRMRGIC